MENQNKNETEVDKENNKKDKKQRVLITILLVIIAILLLCLLLRSCGNTEDIPIIGNKTVFDLTRDSNATKGELESKSQEEIESELNEKVAEGMVNISMNLEIIFPDSKSEGTLNIVNSEINNHPQVVEIYLDDTNELIYKSGVIDVGSKVEKGKLQVELEKGTYDCTAYFNSIDENTGELLGKAGAKVVINIEK